MIRPNLERNDTSKMGNIGTKCNSLTQQFICISTIIDTWATCFDSYRVIFRPSKNTDPILQGSQVHCWIPNAYIVVIVTIWNRIYEGWNFNSGNYLFTTDTK